MLNTIWNYATPIKNSIAQNKPTDTFNNNYTYQNKILKGALYFKQNDSEFLKISNNCLIEINNHFSEYPLKIKYNENELLVDNDTKLFQFNNNFGNKCITWQKNTVSYILELFNGEETKGKENVFLIKLPSINPAFFDETKTFTNSKNNIEFSNVNNNNNFSLLSEKYNNRRSIGNDSMFYQLNEKRNNNEGILKDNFMKRFEEYKEIYIVKGTAFRYDKLLEEVIAFKDYENDSIQSFLKVNYIGNNAYILVLEQNNKIISFIKITNENDISINENSSSISFNYMNEKGEYNPYIFSFEEKSSNEINFFKNLILRCIYEKNNNLCEFNLDPNMLNFDSIDIYSEFDHDNNCDKSFFFSTKKKNDRVMMLFEENNKESGLNKNDFKKENNNFFSNDNSSKINLCDKKNIIIKEIGNIEIHFDNSGIKLYNRQGEDIQALITGRKDPIKYIDISHDNKYLLITCDKYLSIIDTDFQNKNTGAIILRLSQNDLLQYNIINDSFSYAKFISNEKSEEKMIISNICQYIIIWNFEKILKGEIYSYRIINPN